MNMYPPSPLDTRAGDDLSAFMKSSDGCNSDRHNACVEKQAVCAHRALISVADARNRLPFDLPECLYK